MGHRIKFCGDKVAHRYAIFLYSWDVIVDPAILKFCNSQILHISNSAFLKFCDSQIRHLSNSAIWGRHHQLTRDKGQIVICSSHSVRVQA